MSIKLLLPPSPKVDGAKNKTATSKTPKKLDGILLELILKVGGSSKRRNGLSLVTLNKAPEADGYILQQNDCHINAAVKRLISSEKLVQTKGTSAASSFKLNKEKSSKVKKIASPRKLRRPQSRLKRPRTQPKTQAAAASLKQFSKKSAKVKKNGNKVLPRSKGKTKAMKSKSKSVTKGFKNKKATLKKIVRGRELSGGGDTLKIPMRYQ
uniref:H15 domain-containing protein n=1 Tax=Eptatretus burgeri TaxID=7764 RepID=A0A8C4Q2H4_EPTBU